MPPFRYGEIRADRTVVTVDSTMPRITGATPANNKRFRGAVTLGATKVKVTSAPRNGAKVKGTVTVKASASDPSGVNRVKLLINGKVVAKDYKAGYAFKIKVSKYGKKIKMQVRSYDRVGNVAYYPARTWKR